MAKLILYPLFGGILITMSILRANSQEVEMFGGRAEVPQAMAQEGSDGIQDEGELASALGIDRNALYEDLMRIQEELAGSPFMEQNGQASQEDYWHNNYK